MKFEFNLEGLRFNEETKEAKRTGEIAPVKISVEMAPQEMIELMRVEGDILREVLHIGKDILKEYKEVKKEQAKEQPKAE